MAEKNSCFLFFFFFSSFFHRWCIRRSSRKKINQREEGDTSLMKLKWRPSCLSVVVVVVVVVVVIVNFIIFLERFSFSIRISGLSSHKIIEQHLILILVLIWAVVVVVWANWSMSCWCFFALLQNSKCLVSMIDTWPAHFPALSTPIKTKWTL